MCEKNSDFGEKFIKLSRDVHFLNDKRAEIKLEINNYSGSKIKEVKFRVSQVFGVATCILWHLYPDLSCQ